MTEDVREFLEKLLEFRDADYVPNSLFERAEGLLQAARATPADHSDDRAVDNFARLMKQKMAASRAKGRGGWDDPNVCSVESLSAMLHEHVAKGDPVDVANFCMMLCHYGAKIAPADQEPVARVNVLSGDTFTKWLTKLPDGVHDLYIAVPQPPQNAADHIVDANKKVDADHGSPQFEAVKNAGYQLANCAFNLAQRPGEKLSLANCKTLDTCRKDWDAAIHALKDAQSVRDAWISVDERLPEIIEMYPGSGTGSSDPVLVYLADENDNGEEIAVWRCFRGGQGDTTTIHWDWNSPKVTHWQPLPAPPQKPVSDEVQP